MELTIGNMLGVKQVPRILILKQWVSQSIFNRVSCRVWTTALRSKMGFYLINMALELPQKLLTKQELIISVSHEELNCVPSKAYTYPVSVCKSHIIGSFNI